MEERRVFISYFWKEEREVNLLSSFLRAYDLEVHISDGSIVPSKLWASLLDEVEPGDIHLVFFGQYGASSKELQRQTEWVRAERPGIQEVPILAEGTHLPEWYGDPGELQPIKPIQAALDLANVAGPKEGLTADECKRLIAVVERAVGKDEKRTLDRHETLLKYGLLFVGGAALYHFFIEGQLGEVSGSDDDDLDMLSKRSKPAQVADRGAIRALAQGAQRVVAFSAGTATRAGILAATAKVVAVIGGVTVVSVFIGTPNPEYIHDESTPLPKLTKTSSIPPFIGHGWVIPTDHQCEPEDNQLVFNGFDVDTSTIPPPPASEPPPKPTEVKPPDTKPETPKDPEPAPCTFTSEEVAHQKVRRAVKDVLRGCQYTLKSRPTLIENLAGSSANLTLNVTEDGSRLFVKSSQARSKTRSPYRVFMDCIQRRVRQPNFAKSLSGVDAHIFPIPLQLVFLGETNTASM